MPPAEPDLGPPQAGQLHVDAVAVPAEQRRRLRDRQRHIEPTRPSPDDRERRAGRTGHCHVAAFDDRGLLAGDRLDRRAELLHVVQRDVGDHRHAAIPRVRRVQPAAESDLDERDIGLLLREPAEDHRGEQLELGRVAVPSSHSVGNRKDLVDEARKRHGIDRPPVDLQSFAVAHEVRLGRRRHTVSGSLQGGPGEGQHAALPVRARDKRAAHGALRIAQFAQERPRAPEPEPDPEPAAVGQRLERRLVRQRGHRPVTRGSARPRRTRTG